MTLSEVKMCAPTTLQQRLSVVDEQTADISRVKLMHALWFAPYWTVCTTIPMRVHCVHGSRLIFNHAQPLLKCGRGTHPHFGQCHGPKPEVQLCQIPVASWLWPMRYADDDAEKARLQLKVALPNLRC